MNEAEAEAGTPSPDDTAAFQRFYAEAPVEPMKRQDARPVVPRPDRVVVARRPLRAQTGNRG
jgi:hypothetical protein